ncbi:alpha/beta fold hydrolase [Streptomyces sp. IMTB 1903]|uniref:alpha/beta fold hydrolase n=1 Tax=Streptomyces sp. IMTB 1903 TaxID=1776680 RepID=UPI0007C6C441|nr:alpha/beta fold hydrolase [Streptomyces sp. IMTB 1903]
MPPARAALVPASGHRLTLGATAAVLLLHGGRADALSPPPRLNLPALRMRPFATALTRATAHADVLVAHVRYRYRGWNGHHAHPVADARRALEELRALAGPVPVVLVGHSMGGRAALRAAEDPQVAGVVVLAPWCPPAEPAAHLRARAVVALHDEHDRVTRAADTWAYLARARAAEARVHAIRMPRGGHAMIGDAGLWHRITAGAAAALLGLAPFPDGPGGLAGPDPNADATAGPPG